MESSPEDKGPQRRPHRTLADQDDEHVPASQDFEFDPTAFVDSGGVTPDHEEAEKKALAKAIEQQLRLPRINAADFDSFDDDAIPATVGRYAFTVRKEEFASALTSAVRALDAKPQSKSREVVAIRVALFPMDIKLSGFNGTVFFGIRIGTRGTVSGVTDQRGVYRIPPVTAALAR